LSRGIHDTASAPRFKSKIGEPDGVFSRVEFHSPQRESCPKHAETTSWLLQAGAVFVVKSGLTAFWLERLSVDQNSLDLRRLLQR
jgi:hypothetical protein